MSSTQASDIKILCPKDRTPLELSVLRGMAGNYVGNGKHGLVCPKCDYEI